MIYTNEVIDRTNGELKTIDIGDWITIAELADLFGVGRRQATTILRRMDFLQVEGGGRDCRHRISNWVIKRGWGKRLKRKADKFPFDVIGPDAQEWITERWSAALRDIQREKSSGPVADAKVSLGEYQVRLGRTNMNVQMCICWFTDYFPSLTQAQIASALDVTQQLVSKYLNIRSAQLNKFRALNISEIPQLVSTSCDTGLHEEYTEEHNQSENDFCVFTQQVEFAGFSITN